MKLVKSPNAINSNGPGALGIPGSHSHIHSNCGTPSAAGSENPDDDGTSSIDSGSVYSVNSASSFDSRSGAYGANRQQSSTSNYSSTGGGNCSSSRSSSYTEGHGGERKRKRSSRSLHIGFEDKSYNYSRHAANQILSNDYAPGGRLGRQFGPGPVKGSCSIDIECESTRQSSGLWIMKDFSEAMQRV